MIIVPTEKRIDWKKPPIALFAIILINVLVFFLYQSLDQHRFQTAIDNYYEYGLFEIELSSYKTYLAKSNQPRIDPRRINQDTITMQLLSDKGFTEFLNANGQNTIVPEDYTRWKQQRDNVNQFWSKLSSEAFGLKPNFLNPVTIITYQFLHGSLLHLLGNMVLLLLVGFAAEAALGSIRFTAYYLISGIGSGLLFSLIEVQTGSGMQSLVGASGSLSGIMAIYVVLFRSQKIEFFYWIAIFTGYFRATALVILPIYLVKEIYFYFSNDGSNVAYTAHLGGFITGAVLLLLTQKVSSKSINKHYIEEVKPTEDTYLSKLNKLYKYSGQCEFVKAWGVLTTLKKEYGNNSDLLEIQLVLLKAINPKKIPTFLLSKLGNTYNNLRVISAQYQCWKSLSNAEKNNISFEQKYQFACDLLLIEKVEAAVKIYQSLKNDSNKQKERSAVLARKIAAFYQQNNRYDIAKQYDESAMTLMTLTKG